MSVTNGPSFVNAFVPATLRTTFVVSCPFLAVSAFVTVATFERLTTVVLASIQTLPRVTRGTSQGRRGLPRGTPRVSLGPGGGEGPGLDSEWLVGPEVGERVILGNIRDPDEGQTEPRYETAQNKNQKVGKGKIICRKIK